MITYLTSGEFAERIGLPAKSTSLNGLKLPPPDAMIGRHRGWLPATIDAWQARRPGSGRTSDPNWHLPPELRPAKPGRRR